MATAERLLVEERSTFILQYIDGWGIKGLPRILEGKSIERP